jgi:integrase
MRLQEALASPAGFNPSNGTIRISKRKEDPRPITIPTTYQGGRLMQRMTPFKVEANEASTLFSKLTKQMGITGLEFKDSRATALTLMSQKMDVKTLQRISRHKDINILINCYYRETAESISARLLVTSARVGSQPLQQRY